MLAKEAESVLLAFTGQVASVCVPRHSWLTARGSVAVITCGTWTWHTGEAEYPAQSRSPLPSCRDYVTKVELCEVSRVLCQAPRQITALQQRKSHRLPPSHMC